MICINIFKLTLERKKTWSQLSRWPHILAKFGAQLTIQYNFPQNSLNYLVSLHCLPLYQACLCEGFFLFPCLNSFPWQQALQTSQWFLCAKWIPVKRFRWNLSTPGDQIDPTPAQDEGDQSSKSGNAKKLLPPTHTHGCGKVATDFVL